MGNWRKIYITGTCPKEEVELLRERITYKYPDFRKPMEVTLNEERTYVSGPLLYSAGVCGLPLWPAEEIQAIGNCFERDYSVEDIAEHLKRLIGASPGLKLKIHCGGEYESSECVATVMVLHQHVSIQKTRNCSIA